jgi:WD40 repeat protein
MAVKTYFAFNRPSDIGPFQCFEFDTGDVKQVSWPDFPESESITAICASEGWVCTAIGSFEDPKILVWDRKSKQTIATLLDQHCDRTNNGYKYYSDIVIRGTTLAGTTHNGRVVLWDTFTIDQADPSRSFNTRRDMWSKSGVETILLTAHSAFILNRLHRTAAAVIFDNEIHQVTEWDDPWVSEPSHTNKYRWVSRDFSFKAEGYEIEPRTGSFATADYRSTSVPRIDIFKVGQPKPFVGLNPIKKSVVDLGSFFTAIIDKNCITMVGSDGIVQITFGAGGEHKLGCSGYISTSQAINGFDTSTKMLFQTYKHRLKDIHGWE